MVAFSGQGHVIALVLAVAVRIWMQHRRTGWKRWKSGLKELEKQMQIERSESEDTRIMKVILQQDVKGQGKKGQMVEVSEGYGRNFLLPRKLAIARHGGRHQHHEPEGEGPPGRGGPSEGGGRGHRRKSCKECQVKLTAKAGSGGRLFGAVTTKEISDGLKAQFSIDIPKQKLVLDEPIKAFGSATRSRPSWALRSVGTVYVSVFEEK